MVTKGICDCHVQHARHIKQCKPRAAPCKLSLHTVRPEMNDAWA